MDKDDDKTTLRSTGVVTQPSSALPLQRRAQAFPRPGGPQLTKFDLALT